MEKNQIIRKVLEKLESSDYIDPAEHIYDAIKVIKRKLNSNLTQTDIGCFLRGLESSANIDIDGVLAECVNILKNEFVTKEKAIEELFETMDTVHSIQCTNCRKIAKKYNCSEEYASESFYKDGWRYKEDEYVYCPMCSEVNGKL